MRRALSHVIQDGIPAGTVVGMVGAYGDGEILCPIRAVRSVDDTNRLHRSLPTSAPSIGANIDQGLKTALKVHIMWTLY
jgi:hypothetical protein